MASPSKKNNRKRNNAKSTSAKGSSSISGSNEIIFLVIVCISLLIFFSNLGFGGKFTKWISDFIFGLFGFAAFIFPIALIACSLFLVSNGRIKRAKSKTAALVLFTVVCASFSQFLYSTDPTRMNVFDFYLCSAKKHIGGGFLGGSVYKILHAAIGNVGFIIFCIFAVIIGVILLTEKSFVSLVSDKYKQSSEKHKEKKQERLSYEANRTERTQTDFKMPLLENDHDIEKPVEKNIELSDKPVINDTAKEEKPTVREKTRLRRQKEKADEIAVAAVTAEDEEISLSEPKKEKFKSEPLKDTDFNHINSEDNFRLPPISLFTKNNNKQGSSNRALLQETALNLQNTLKSFGINVNITDVSCGPAVTRYEFRPEAGVKVSKILSLADDIKLNLAVNDIRIEAPVPGKAAVGIEVPNATKSSVLLRDLLESEELINAKSPLAFAAGKDVSGKVVVADLAKMPHMLVSGTTGSGKSVFTNSILMTYLYRCKPQDVRFIIIDPKVVEFGIYNGIPNLIIPVVTDPKKAAGALNWAVSEMTSRYKKFADMHVRDLESYNRCIDEKQYELSLEDGEEVPEKLPKIVIIIDELADLMMVAAKEVEEAICRLAQLARAAGIHMIIATQRPSVDVITGLIKANIPSRVALTVASGTDSRTILDMNGAEKLLGRGDMLFYPSDYPKPLRVQGSYVSDKEIAGVVDYLKNQSENTNYDEKILKMIDNASVASSSGINSESGDNDGRDELFADAGRLICDKQKASIGSLQRVFRIGFNRAARIMDQLCDANVVGPEQGTKAREVLMNLEEFEIFINELHNDEE